MRLLFFISLAIFTGCRPSLNEIIRTGSLDSFFYNYIVKNKVEKIILSERGNLFFKTGTVHGYLKGSPHPLIADIEFAPGALTDFSSYMIEHEDDIPDSVTAAPVYLNGNYLFRCRIGGIEWRCDVSRSHLPR